jgi:hypothetical protein
MELVKWYLDVTTPDGRCAILYAARLRLLGRALALHGATWLDGGRVRTRWSVLPARSPRRDGGRLHFRSAPLRVSAEVEPIDAPHAARLLQGPAGLVDWECHVPRGRARIRVGDVLFEGPGYAERLRITVPPGDLPIRALRWGRLLSATGGLVWIAWEGPAPIRLALRDGRPVRLEWASDGRVSAGGGVHPLRNVATLRDAPLSSTLPAAVRRALPRVGLGLAETKWLARGTLGGEPALAIHEVVRWP